MDNGFKVSFGKRRPILDKMGLDCLLTEPLYRDKKSIRLGLTFNYDGNLSFLGDSGFPKC